MAKIPVIAAAVIVLWKAAKGVYNLSNRLGDLIELVEDVKKQLAPDGEGLTLPQQYAVLVKRIDAASDDRKRIYAKLDKLEKLLSSWDGGEGRDSDSVAGHPV